MKLKLKMKCILTNEKSKYHEENKVLQNRDKLLNIYYANKQMINDKLVVKIKKKIYNFI